MTPPPYIPIVKTIAITTLSTYLSFKLTEYLMNMASTPQTTSLSRSILKKLALPPSLALTKNEQKLLHSIILPRQIDQTFSDIGGLDNIINTIKQTILEPLKCDINIERHPLLQSPMGILLHGPPGTGKTLLAKAIANQSDLRFLNVNISDIMNKYVGESEKMVASVFSLAQKIAPCIIFIDEIDVLLKKRGGFTDNESLALMKAEFLSQWDGLNSSHKKAKVVLMGATNRIDDIDPAFLRRLPVRLNIPIPDSASQIEILRKILKGIEIEFDLEEFVMHTLGFTGSDLKEISRIALLSGGQNCWSITGEMMYCALDKYIR